MGLNYFMYKDFFSFFIWFLIIYLTTKFSILFVCYDHIYNTLNEIFFLKRYFNKISLVSQFPPKFKRVESDVLIKID